MQEKLEMLKLGVRNLFTRRVRGRERVESLDLMNNYVRITSPKIQLGAHQCPIRLLSKLCRVKGKGRWRRQARKSLEIMSTLTRDFNEWLMVKQQEFEESTKRCKIIESSSHEARETGPNQSHVEK